MKVTQVLTINSNTELETERVPNGISVSVWGSVRTGVSPFAYIVLQSKLLKGAYVGQYIGDYCREHYGDTWIFGYGSNSL